MGETRRMRKGKMKGERRRGRRKKRRRRKRRREKRRKRRTLILFSFHLRLSLFRIPFRILKSNQSKEKGKI